MSIVPEKLDSITFDRLLASNNPFVANDGMFDLRGVQFISPCALVQLAAACHALARADKKTLIHVEEEGIRSWLLRAGFARAVQSVADFLPTIPPARSLLFDLMREGNPLLIEVTELQSSMDLPALLNQIVRVLRYRLRYKKYDAFDVAKAVSEMAQNTFDHNHGVCGFLAMQVFGSGPSRFLEIGVADYGSGLRATLQNNPACASSIHTDRQAIHHATQLGVSEFAMSDSTRGTGLYHLLQIAYRHGGTVQIRSGVAKARYRADRQQAWMFDVPPMPGVQLALLLPTKAAS